MANEEYKKWFDDLWAGYESYGNQKLFGKTATHSLVKMYHPPSYVRYGGRLPGITEWMVVVNGEFEQSGAKAPKHIWKKEGRLLNEDKKLIKEKFDLKFDKNITL